MGIKRFHPHAACDQTLCDTRTLGKQAHPRADTVPAARQSREAVMRGIARFGFW